MGSDLCWATNLLASRSILPMACQFCHFQNETIDVVSSLRGKCMENACSLEAMFPVVGTVLRNLEPMPLVLTRWYQTITLVSQ